MMYPKNRSNSVRKIKIRTAKGPKLHFERKIKGKKHYCAICGGILAGTTNERNSAKSERRPSRKFGGNLCVSCTKDAIKAKARLESKSIGADDIDIQLRRYVK